MPSTESARTIFHSDDLVVEEILCHGATDDGREERVPLSSFVIPRSGVFLRTDARGEVVGDPNMALLFGKDEPYSVRHPTGRGDLSTMVSMSAKAFQEMAGDAERAGFGRGYKPMSVRHHRIHHALIRRSLEGEDPLAVEEGVLSLIGGLLEAPAAGSDSRALPGRPGTEDDHRTVVRRAQLILAERYRTSISLADLGREVYSSPFHLCRIFRRWTGFTIHRYRETLRILEAVRRLGEGEDSLARLALDLGFSQHSHMTRAFRSLLGYPPSVFRRSSARALMLEASRRLAARAVPLPARSRASHNPKR